MIKEQVYSSYAFAQDETEKRKNNSKIYQQIKDKAIREQLRDGYAHQIIKVTPKPNEKLTLEEMALIADRGNLCFGYQSLVENSEYCVFKIYTD